MKTASCASTRHRCSGWVNVIDYVIACECDCHAPDQETRSEL